MKFCILFSLHFILIFWFYQANAQQGREIFSKGYNSTPAEIERYEDGTWLFITLHSQIPGEIYQDTFTVYHTDSTGRILRSFELTPPRNFENFVIEDLVALPGERFVAVYSGGDCDAGGYGYYAESRDTSGQLLWLTQLPKGYAFQAIGIGIDSNILISFDAFVIKYSASDGSILWEAEHNDTYTYDVIIVPGTEDILLVDHTGLKYFRQDTVSGEITYHLQAFKPLEVSQGIIGELLADGDSLFYAYKYAEKKILRFKQDLQPTVFATLTKQLRDMESGNNGVYSIIQENLTSYKLYFIDSSGNQLLLKHFKDSVLRPIKLLHQPDGIGLIGSYGSGPELPLLPGYKYVSRSQAWFNYFPKNEFDEPSDSIDLAITNILQQDSIYYETYWSPGPFPAYLSDFEGGNFRIEITNHGRKTVRSCWMNIAFGANENTWFCPPVSVKQLFLDNLELLPGGSTWVEFGDIYAYSQAEVPDQYCFWTSAPNHFPDDFPDNDAFCLDRIVAVHEIYEDLFSLFPNPADETLYVEWKEDYAAHQPWVISDLYGRLLLRGQRIASDGIETISLHNVPSGLYTFHSGPFSNMIFVQH